jgi:single-strand DNA-binding protein
MRGLNRIVVLGRLGQDPELRQAKNGNPWASFSVATSRGRKDGDTWIEETDWHDVRVFGDEAERCHRRLRKGSVVAVDGAMVYDTWTDEAGARRRKPRIHATRVSFVSDLRPAEGQPEVEREPTLDALPL